MNATVMKNLTCRGKTAEVTLIILIFVLRCLLQICVMETQVSSGELNVNKNLMWTKNDQLAKFHSQYDQKLRKLCLWILSI